MTTEDCNICKWFDKDTERLIVSAGRYFTLFFPKVPMVYREDGGHLILIPNRHVVDVRFFSPAETIEYMAFTRTASEVMYDLVPKMMIPIGRVNYHDNGNFEADKKIGAHQHLHIYGRSKTSVNQVWKGHLNFPEWNPDHPYYRQASHFSDAEKTQIRNFVREIFPKHLSALDSIGAYT